MQPKRHVAEKERERKKMNTKKIKGKIKKKKNAFG